MAPTSIARSSETNTKKHLHGAEVTYFLRLEEGILKPEQASEFCSLFKYKMLGPTTSVSELVGWGGAPESAFPASPPGDDDAADGGTTLWTHQLHITGVSPVVLSATGWLKGENSSVLFWVLT